MEENNVAASEREAAVCDVLLKISVYKKKKGEARNKIGLGSQNLWPQEHCCCRRLPRVVQVVD